MENYIANIIPHVQSWWHVLIRLAYLFGVSLAVISLIQVVSHKQRFNRSVAVWTFCCAVLFVNFPMFMDSLAMTLFNQSSEQSLSYSPPSSPSAVYIQFVVFAVGIVGVIGIMRGLFLLRETSKQSMNFSRGMVHLFGGIIAVNLVTFLRGIGVTIGGEVQNYITAILG